MTHHHLPDGILPWTRSCFVCGEDNKYGLRLKSRMVGGAVVIEYTPRPSDLGYSHIVHGGIVMTLLDEVMTWAAIIAAGKMCVMAEMSTRLLNPVAVGQQLRIEGRVTRHASRLLLTEGVAFAVDGTIAMSRATGKYLPMSEDKIRLCEKDFVYSPAALPLETILPGTKRHP